MGNYGAPGVYVEEVESAIKPIAGVGTSTAGFIGVATDATNTEPKPGTDMTELVPPAEDAPAGSKGTPKTRATHPDEFTELAPIGVPQLITGWDDFRRSFGAIQASNTYLAHAVFGFFHNGGTRCWVARFDSSAAGPAVPTKAQVDTALEAFAAIDEIALVAAPGVTDVATRNAVVEHCSDVNLQDRFAILDGARIDGRSVPLTKAGTIGTTADSDYGAIYFPWIDVGATKADGVTVEPVPPSGHIAGVYARVDATRGVHKAPANEPIRGAVGVEKQLSRADQAGLNLDGVNVIRQFGGTVTVWGARTIGGDANLEWKYVSVRRLFNYLRESIDQGTQWVVFEPNGPELWSRIRRNVGSFLTGVWSSGALFGATPEEAFYVRCDEGLNPAGVREQGQVVCEIGVAVVSPAEFVVFRISQWAGPGR
jgi:uncharacterized protein